MPQARRGATLAKRGPAYICPQAEADFFKDERSHIKARPSAQHPFVRVWEPEELE